MLEADQPERPAYAVCPRITRSGADKAPILFKTKDAAEAWHGSEVRFPLDDPQMRAAFERDCRAEAETEAENLAKITGRPIEQVREHLRGTTSKSKSKPRPRSKPDAEPIRNGCQGGKMVAVCYLGNYSGQNCSRAFRDFLPPEKIAGGCPQSEPGPTIDFDLPDLNQQSLIREALNQESGEFTCCLGADWKFDEIDTDARKRAGHRFNGRRHDNIALVLVEVAYDLEAAVRGLHPNLPSKAFAHFWTSWHVHLHIAEFCQRLAVSLSDARRANSKEWREQVEGARRFVYQQLEAFAFEVSGDTEPNADEFSRKDPRSPAKIPGKRKGYRPEIRAYMSRNGLQTNSQAARHFGVSLDTLKNIMSNRGPVRYSKETLETVLKKAGIEQQPQLTTYSPLHSPPTHHSG